MNSLHPRSLAVAAVERLPTPVVKGLRGWLANRRERALAERIRSLVAVTEWETPRCVICGQYGVTPHTRSNGFEIVRCEGDGLIFVSPRPADVSPFYDERYYTGGMPGVYSDYEEASAQVSSDWRERLEYLEGLIGRKGSLLDVGCATGSFLDLARSRGWETSGLELSAWAAAQALNEKSLSVVQGSLPDERIPAEAYDVVTLWDCVEHLSEPRKVLLDARRILKPGGVLMLSTGAVPHEDRRLVSRWYYPPWHLYYFSEETIKRLLTDCGFALESYSEKDKHIPEYTLMVVAARRLD